MLPDSLELAKPVTEASRRDPVCAPSSTLKSEKMQLCSEMLEVSARSATAVVVKSEMINSAQHSHAVSEACLEPKRDEEDLSDDVFPATRFWGFFCAQDTLALYSSCVKNIIRPVAQPSPSVTQNCHNET